MAHNTCNDFDHLFLYSSMSKLSYILLIFFLIFFFCRDDIYIIKCNINGSNHKSQFKGQIRVFSFFFGSFCFKSNQIRHYIAFIFSISAYLDPELLSMFCYSQMNQSIPSFYYGYWFQNPRYFFFRLIFKLKIFCVKLESAMSRSICTSFASSYCRF